MPYGLPWSEAFVRQLTDKDVRDAFVAEHVRLRIAQLVRVLRECPDRNWTQTELGERAGKKQNVISRLENPDSAQPSVQTLLEVAAAFDLPLWIDMPDWEDWFRRLDDTPHKGTNRSGFDAESLISIARCARHAAESGTIAQIGIEAKGSKATLAPAQTVVVAA